MSYPIHRWTDSRGEEQERELVPSEQGQHPEPDLVEAAWESTLREREAVASFPLIPPVDRVCVRCGMVWNRVSALIDVCTAYGKAIVQLQKRVDALEDMSARHSHMLAVTPDPGRGCDEDKHVWVDARNSSVDSGEYCTLCGALRPTTIDTLADIPASWYDR